MAVTSSTSAELIAVSSLLTFDIYKTYIHPHATSSRLVHISHLSIILYAIVLAVFCCILNAVSVDLTWLLTVQGIIVGGASVPVGLVLLWPQMSTVATVASAWVGLAMGLVAWFVTTSKRSGSVTVATLGDATNAVAGNLASSVGGALVAVVLTVVMPGKVQPLGGGTRKRVQKIDGTVPEVMGGEEAGSGRLDEKEVGEETMVGREKKGEAAGDGEPASAPEPETLVPTGNDVVDFLEAKHIEPMDPVAVKRSTRFALGFNVVYCAVALILVPFALFGTGYVFSKPFFTGWVVVSFLWVWCSACICIVWPLWESRSALWRICRGLVADMGTRGRARSKGQQVEERV